MGRLADTYGTEQYEAKLKKARERYLKKSYLKLRQKPKVKVIMGEVGKAVFVRVRNVWDKLKAKYDTALKKALLGFLVWALVGFWGSVVWALLGFLVWALLGFWGFVFWGLGSLWVFVFLL